jgi:hypothetical protein
LVEPAGEEFMRINLMTGVPNEPVLGKVERGMEGDAEFDDTEVGGEVNGSGIVEFAEFASNFGGEEFESVCGKILQIVRRL